MLEETLVAAMIWGGCCVTEYEVGGRLPEEALLVDFLCLSPTL